MHLESFALPEEILARCTRRRDFGRVESGEPRLE